MAHAGGRPPLYTDVEELQKIIDEYFDYCDNRIQQVYSKKTESVIEIINPAPYTVIGLARRLGMTRETLLRYAEKDKFSDTIKDAKARVQEDIENRLMETQATGAIFNLKNNFGYVDKQEIDQNISGEIKTGEPDPKLAADFAEYLRNK